MDATFLSRVLATGPDARIDIHGTENGTTGRVRATVRAPGTEPTDVFVKVPSGRRRARMLAEIPALTAAEARFYSQLGDEVPDAPAHHYAAHARGRFAIVLEDLTGRCTLHDGGHPCTPAEAAAVVDVLARLHGTFWDDPRLESQGSLGWLGSLRRRETRLGDLLAVPLTELGLRRAANLIPPELRSPARRHARRRRSHMEVLAAGPTTLVHADCHPGNIAFTRQSPPGAVLCDWQMVRTGSWARDVAYFLATGLDARVRRSHGIDLFERYLEGLAAAGGPALDPAQADIVRRAHTVVAFEAMVVTIGVGGLMGAEVIEALVARTARAVIDDDAFTALSTLVTHCR
ncbi:MAG: aminoglycoside phosphotransferase family protein [Acidimicrobiales bacterium]